MNSTEQPGPLEVRLSDLLGPLVECGWRYVRSEVWGDQVLTQDPKAAQLARKYGRDVQPLYALTPEEVAAVNKLRARNEWMKRDTARCKCDHNEYCQHCYPESFRPGGVWHGIGA